MLALHTVHAEVSNMDASVAFYESVLGVEFTVKSPYWSQFQVGDLAVGLHPVYTTLPAVGGWVIGFRVESIEEWIAKLDGLGITHSEIDKLHDGTQMVSFQDPDGNRLQVIQPG